MVYVLGSFFVLALVYLFVFGLPQSVTQAPTVGGVVVCDTEPYMDNATFNSYSKGTGVAVTYSYVTEGNEASARTLTPGSGGTAFNVGDKLTILSSASGYIDQVDKFTITKCGANSFTNYIYGADGGTVDILDQNFNAVSDDAGATGTVNITGSANPVNFVIRLDGVVKESTGQLYITVEGNDTEVDDMSISLKSGTGEVIDGDAPILDIFTAEGTAPTIKKAFIVKEILDGGQVDYNIKVTPESGMTLGGGATTGFIYVNVYAGQWFIDTDGSLQFGWEDSDGTPKYETKFTDHDALIKA